MVAMTQIFELTRDDPVIHLKAYGGVQVVGVVQAEVSCEIDSPKQATILEEDGDVYITIISSCQITVPVKSTILLERGMGSVKVSNIHGMVKIEKVLGNLVLNDVGAISVGKVGGNFSVRNSGEAVKVEKVAGNLIVEDVSAFSCEKVGGSCKTRLVHGSFHLEKIGGSFTAQDMAGRVHVENVGGSFSVKGVSLEADFRVGGDIKLFDLAVDQDLSIKAGGDIKIGLTELLDDVSFVIQSGSGRIKVKAQEEDLVIDEHSYSYQIGGGSKNLSLAAGGDVLLSDQLRPDGNVVGDLSSHFKFEESAFSEMIQERIQFATKKAESKVRSAEIRLAQVRERLEKQHGIEIDLGLGSKKEASTPQPPVSPPVIRPAGKKGATDEERLMILKMLQDKRITVEEAETLFNALED
jgi:hypothetical protein